MDRPYWEDYKADCQRGLDLATRLLDDDMEVQLMMAGADGHDVRPYHPSADQILANLKMHIEQFDLVDVDDGRWAYNAIAKVLFAERLAQSGSKVPSIPGTRG